MKNNMILAVVFVTLGSAASAMGCDKGHQEQAMSCGEGYVWDSASQTCVEQTNS